MRLSLSSLDEIKKNNEYKSLVDFLQGHCKNSIYDIARIESVCLISFYSCTRKDERVLYSVACMWLFALDDYLDNLINPTEGYLVIQSLYAGLNGAAREENSFLTELRTIEEMINFSSEERRMFWSKIIHGVIEGMEHELQLKFSTSDEPYFTYMKNAINSIGTPMVLGSVLLIHNSKALRHDLVNDYLLSEPSFYITRLLNDLRSNKKEVLEGKKNSISFLSSKDEINDIIDLNIDILRRYKKFYTSKTYHSIVLRTSVFTKFFYSKMDFHPEYAKTG